MGREATNSAGALIRRARGITARHHILKTLFRTVAAGALLAAVLAATARLLGFAPGAWTAVAVLPLMAVVALGLRGARPPLDRAALLLDRAAGTRERFLASLTADDPEVRELAAEQALAHPEIATGAFPLQFPPSTEGLAAALATAILLGVLLMPGGGPDDPGRAAGGPGLPALPGVPGAPPGNARRSEVPAPDQAPLSAEVEQITTRMAAGEGIDADDWKTLEQAGLAKRVRDEVTAALARGEPDQAARAVRRALRKSRGSTTASPPAPPPDAGWDAYRRSLEVPLWSPEYDDLVRRYFTGAAERGVR